MADGMAALGARKMRLCAALFALALALAGCGEKDEPDPGTAPAAAQSTATTPATTAATAHEHPTKPHGEPTKPAETPPGDPRRTELEHQAERVVRGYLNGLNDHDGAGVCGLFVAGAMDEIEFPEDRGDCAASLTASIGYADPRGLPVWDSLKLTDLRVSELDHDGRSAKVIASVVTTFADRDEPSIEDDVIYLTRKGDHWLIAKPSAELYRAIGAGDVPPSVFAPPSG